MALAALLLSPERNTIPLSLTTRLPVTARHTAQPDVGVPGPSSYRQLLQPYLPCSFRPCDPP